MLVMLLHCSSCRRVSGTYAYALQPNTFRFIRSCFFLNYCSYDVLLLSLIAKHFSTCAVIVAASHHNFFSMFRLNIIIQIISIIVRIYPCCSVPDYTVWCSISRDLSTSQHCLIFPLLLFSNITSRSKRFHTMLLNSLSLSNISTSIAL